jgi:uncharacterized protein YabN with tetrapyrrole methylase and pyrophosphatase domain
VHDKLVRRHPHVFGDVRVAGADEVVTNWEQIKKAEKGVTSVDDGITPGLPALIYAQKLYRKATSVGLDPIPAPAGAVRAAADAVEAAAPSDVEHALGELLAAAAALARAQGIDAESALAGWAGRFKVRFREMEALAEADGVDLAAAEAGVVAGYWARTHVR